MKLSFYLVSLGDMKSARVFNLILSVAMLLAAVPAAAEVDRLQRLKSQIRDGTDFYRDGVFTISKLSKQPLSGNLTAIRGFLTNDSNKRAVSVQLEITCYNAAGDLLGTQLVEVNYLDPRDTQQFQAKIRAGLEEITLFEAAIQDAIWDEI